MERKYLERLIRDRVPVAVLPPNRSWSANEGYVLDLDWTTEASFESFVHLPVKSGTRTRYVAVAQRPTLELDSARALALCTWRPVVVPITWIRSTWAQYLVDHTAAKERDRTYAEHEAERDRKRDAARDDLREALATLYGSGAPTIYSHFTLDVRFTPAQAHKLAEALRAFQLKDIQETRQRLEKELKL